MQIFDTHCHIADEAFDEDREAVIRRFTDAGVSHANVVADPCEAIPNQEKVFGVVESYNFLVGSIGVHPQNASRWSDEAEKIIRTYTARKDCVLLGEIGLDYHYDSSPRDVQRDVFDRQLDIAYELNMPVQLHIREAHGDTTDILRSRVHVGRMPGGIMHCYTGSAESAKFYLDAGLYISFSGALTFKNAPKLAEVALMLPDDRILIETDCPYMAPVPLRGRRNEPAFIVHTLTKLAEIRKTSPDKMAEILFENSLHAMRISCQASNTNPKF